MTSTVLAWGARPLTFLTRAHVELAADLPTGVVVAERCACGGYVTFRAVPLELVAPGAVVAVTHLDAADHAQHAPASVQPCDEILTLADLARESVGV